MATIQTNRGLLTANLPADVQRLLSAGLITDAQATKLLADISVEATGGAQAPGLGSLQDQADAAALTERGFTSALDQLRASAQTAAGGGTTPAPAAPTALPAQPDTGGFGRDPRIEFLERRGVGPEGIRAESRAGRFIGSQFDPLQRLFELQQVIGAAGGQPSAGTIGEFTPQFPDRASRSARGSQILSNFFGLTPTQRTDFGLNFDPAFDEEGNDISGGLGVGFLQDLLSQGTRSTRGPRGSQFISGRVPALQQAFQLEQPQQDFVPFLRERLGLAGF